MGPAEARLLQVTGNGGVPADATGVVLNVTAVAPSVGGYMTVYPADVPTPPLASNLNYGPGQTLPNSVTVRLGTGAEPGRIKIFNSAGQTHVIVDVGGYFRGHDHDDRYYAKGQTQARLAANSLSCPAGQFLSTVAADGTPTCGAAEPGPQGPQGIQGPPGPSGPKGFSSVPGLTLPSSGPEAYRLITPPFVVPAGVTSCLVTSTIQTEPQPAASNAAVFFRNAVSRNGLNANDGQHGQYLYNDGAGRKQPPMSRTSVLPVLPGQSVAFGAYFGNLSEASSWHNQGFDLTTSYLCS